MVIFCKNNIENTLHHWVSENHYQSLVIICDENTYQFCLPKLGQLIEKAIIVNIPAGEQYKNLETCQKIWHTMTHHHLDRKALCINLGGGVVGDMGGFCAATYKRGIDFIQIPTTLLSQVDASVGGKLGVDFEGFKNQIGVFKEPNLVLIDTIFLETLSEREKLSGFAEIIKHCLISDKKMWDKISNTNFENQDIDFLVNHSVAIKSKIVEQDPQEKSIRKLLNYGHTIGHALESYFLGTPKPFLHGEAVAWGMVAENFIAYKLGYLTDKELEEITLFIKQHYSKPYLSSEMIENVINLTFQDKKNEQGKHKFVLLKSIGEAVFDVEVNISEIKSALSYLNAII
ncbi:MAG: 3-dehydroquinate synthase [Raineya sp.]|jgi:3-dehydroquinate synthase|nr:3-dehydroquinate synthase [Raineya sp.]